MMSFLHNFRARINTEKWMRIFTLAVVLMVNIQLLFTFFYGEDFLNFLHISSLKNPLEYIFSSMGYHLYIFRNLVFYCMFKLFGVNSVAYFSLVLLTHLGSAFVLYKIIHLLTGKASLAAAGATTWGISPVNYATLAWYTVYGHILVGFFFLLFLYDLLRMEKGMLSFSIKIAIRWSIYFFAMAASYGAGLAIVCLSPFAIIMILWGNNQKWKIAASMLPAIALILLLFVTKDYIYYYFSGSMPHSNPVALSAALSLHKIILEMFIRTISYGIYCIAAFPLLFVFSPKTYPSAALFIAFAVIMLLIVLFFRSKEYRRHYAVFSIFLLGLTGMIAYGRAADYHNFHIPMSTAALTLRHYYTILILVAVLLALAANELFLIFPKFIKTAVFFALFAIFISMYPSAKLAKQMDSLNESESWKEMYDGTIADMETAIRSHPEGSSVFMDNSRVPVPLGTFSTGVVMKAAVFIITYPDNTVEGRRVYFVEKNCRVADEISNDKKWRLSSLIVSACALNKKKTG